MKKLCLIGGLLAIVCAAAYAQEEEKPGDEMRKLQVETRELRDEITRLSLLNSLGLTLEQAQQLKALLDGVKLAHDLHEQRMLENQKETVEVLKKVRDSLAQGDSEPPAELVEKYDELRKKANVANKEFFGKLKEADEEVNGLLSEEQKKKIREGADDPLSTKDDAEAQKARMEQVTKMLDRVRTMNQQQLEQSKEQLMGQLLGRLAADRNIPRQNLQRARATVEEIVKKAREMDELDYALWREEFAGQIPELGKPQARGNARREETRRRGPELSPVAEAMLDEGMLAALEKKIEALKKTGEQEKPGKEAEESDE
jgi:hypothetical protein